MVPKTVTAVTVAQQTNYDPTATLNTWQVLQELGSNLSGVVTSFTFRVSTQVKNNQNQFDFTAMNSKLYDKTLNTYILGCVTNASDRLNGLTFITQDVPTGYEDVSIDFSCRNYSFISGHRYLIYISNANQPSMGGMRIYFAFIGFTGTDYFPDGGLRFAYDNEYCNGAAYAWNSQSASGGCYPFSSTKDDLYFVLNNNSPPPLTPVIFIPGLGGSEFQTAQDIIWSTDDGHSGTYSHAYPVNEKVWVNQDEAVKLGDDDYFDILRLKSDGQTPEADLKLTGNLTSFGYGDIDSFFQSLGYVKGTNFFVFPYDWRKDVRTTKNDLDSLIESAKQKTGLSKVNIVAHSLGGLVARNYISDASQSAKVNKLIELGTPHLGAVDSLKSLLYGVDIKTRIFGIFRLGLPSSEVKDITQTSPSVFQLLPSHSYYSFYNFSGDYPFKDDRDIDQNKETGNLDFNQTKTLLTNLGQNMVVFSMAEQFHDSIDSTLNSSNGVKLYLISGSGQPTLGQIQETWWITWPINFIPKRDELFINGDDTVPLYSSSLKSSTLDLTGGAKLYFVEQTHSDLVSKTGAAMELVKNILSESDQVPVNVQSDKFTLDGKHISTDQDAILDLYDEYGNHTGLNGNGEIETNIPHTFYTTSGKTKHVFVKKKSNKVTVKIKSPTKKSSTNVRIRHYHSDQVEKTTHYPNVPTNDTTPVTFPVDPTVDTPPVIIVDSNPIPSNEATGSAALDQTPPSTTFQISGTQDSGGIYTGPITIILSGTDLGSGILRIEYSLDNGQTVTVYNQPISLTSSGTYTLQFFATDQNGNQEIPQTLTIVIKIPQITSSTSNGTNTTNQTNTSNSSSNSSAPVITLASYQSPKNPISEILLTETEPAEKAFGINPKVAEVLGTSQTSIGTEVKISINLFSSLRIDWLWPFLKSLILLFLTGFLFNFLEPTPYNINNQEPKRDVQEIK